uniref:Uncharacterized protein n=1 Tax=Moniliophthora roreri TaxID=221103 RepID=A0A0W0GAS6_MONRR
MADDAGIANASHI